MLIIYIKHLLICIIIVIRTNYRFLAISLIKKLIVILIFLIFLKNVSLLLLKIKNYLFK